MNTAGLHQAQRILEAATRHADELVGYVDQSTMDAWTNFLIHINRVGNKIVASVDKNNAEERLFVELMKSERINDALLVYLRECRNAKDHGIDVIAKKESFKLTFDDQLLTFNGDQLVLGILTMKDVSLGRSSTILTVPTTHMGCEVPGTPDAFAAAALNYYEEKLRIARSLA